MRRAYAAIRPPGLYGDETADRLRSRSARLATLLARTEASPSDSDNSVRRWAVKTEAVLGELGLGAEELESSYRVVITGALYEWAVRCVEVAGGVEGLLDRLGVLACLLDRSVTSIPPIDVDQISDVVERWNSARSSHPVTSRVLSDLDLNQQGSDDRKGNSYICVPPAIEASALVDPVKKPLRQRGPDTTLTDLHRLLESIESCMLEIDWRRKAVTDQWIEAARLFRALDRALAVEVYSYYSTPPEATRALLARERFQGAILEPCSGGGAISRILEEAGYDVKSSDIRQGPDVHGEGGVDARSINAPVANVVTNPPFRESLSLTEHLVTIAERKVAVLLRVDFLAMFTRRHFFMENPPRTVYVFTERPLFLVGGDPNKRQSGKWEYAWYLWDRDRPGNTEVIYIEKAPRETSMASEDEDGQGKTSPGRRSRRSRRGDAGRA